MFLKAFEDTLLELNGNELLDKVKSVEFSYIGERSKLEESKLHNRQVLEGTDIQIDFTRQDPFLQRPGDKADRLVVAMYAWDGNSFPGKTITDIVKPKP